MGDTAVRVEGLSKQYRIGSQRNRYRTLRDNLSDIAALPFKRLRQAARGERRNGSAEDNTLWALQDVSFEVKRGEVVGIIGRNGAGKSTLLKILSRITEPTRGQADIYGRVGSLLEVGTGFHPELTGRENVYLNGAILGMTRAEIDRKFDAIIAFAEVEKFMNTPVKHYSSGMGLRLGFAVAAHLEPEILVVDEVLAVGDAAFQKKCLGKMDEVAKEGRTVLFVSHNMAAVAALCTKGVLLSNGQIAYMGEVRDVINRYMEMGAEHANTPLAERTDRRGNGRLRFIDVTFEDGSGNTVGAAVSGSPLTIRLTYETRDRQKINNVDAFIAFYGNFGELLFVAHVRLGRGTFDEIPPKGQFVCRIPKFPLVAGRYSYMIEAGVAPDYLMDSVEDAGSLNVEPGDFYGTGNLPMRNHQMAVMVGHSWDLVDLS